MIAGQYYLFEPTTLKTYLKVQRLALRILHFSDTHLGFNYFEIVNEVGINQQIVLANLFDLK